MSLRCICLDLVMGAAALYQKSSKLWVELEGSQVKMAYVSVSDLNSIIANEDYTGCYNYYGQDLLFITAKVPKKWRPYALLHEIGDKLAPEGFDRTGIAKHYQALCIELAYAKATMSDSEYENYVIWRVKIEQSDFFSLRYESLVEDMTSSMVMEGRGLKEEE